jgi:iron complex outermembrane recepter protein
MEKYQPCRKLITRAIATAIALSACGGMNAYAQKAALEEVIVTAQKKEENLQTVPMTVNAVTSETIDKYNMLDFKDVAQVAPGLTIEGVNSRVANISLRGIQVNTDAAAGVAVSIYWNEVGYDIDSAFKAMYDVSRLEVLRGPQGTLRGVTAPAGAITITTATPNYSHIDGYLQQSFSDRSLSNSQFGVSLPIIEEVLAIRLAGVYDHNVGNDVTNVITGTHESQENRSGRLTIGFRPIETVEANLIYQHLDYNADSLLLLSGSGLAGNFNKYDRKSATDVDGFSHSRRDIASLNLNWDLDGHELTYIGGYQRRRIFNLDDQDAGNALTSANYTPSIPIIQTVRSNLQDWSHELRFSSSDGDFYNYTYGVYYSKQQTSTPVNIDRLIGLYNFDADIIFDPLIADVAVGVDSASEGYAVFTNQSFQITDATELQFGLRYQKQKTAVNSTLSVNIPNLAPRNSGNAFIANDEALTGSASIAHQLSDDVNLYANYGRSFRPSGSLPVPSDPPLRAGKWDPETSDSVEIGFKSRWNDARVQLNGDIFYQKFHDFIARANGIYTNNNLQLQQDNGQLSYGFNYSADVIVQGAELSLEALLTDHWQVGTSLSYTDARFNNDDVPCNVFVNGRSRVPVDAEFFVCKSSRRLGSEPNLMASATLEYSWPLSGFEPFVRGLYTYRSFRGNDNVPGGDTPAYGIFNLFVGVRGAEQAWEISVWAKNLFGYQTYTSTGVPIEQGADDQSSGIVPIQTGYRSYQIIPQREVGITGKYNF